MNNLSNNPNPYELETIVRSETIHNGGAMFYFNRCVESGRSKFPYVVGCGLYGFKIDHETLYRGSFATILEGHLSQWRDSEMYFDGFGSWYNEEDSITYVDPIRVYSNLRDALDIAKANGEKCIFNTETGTTVNV